jgi:bifunctional UDP-N-acetylglucosamine pyrophosphorylase / glucosamine-1-phosphate N-acetyltransferase
VVSKPENLDVVILAAGKGTRMYSSKPKVLHAVGGKSMLEHVIDAGRAMNSRSTHVVVGYGADQIKAHFENGPKQSGLLWASQDQQLGTGHAVQQALPGIDTSSNDNLVLILYGDVPLIKAETLSRLLEQADKNNLSLLTLITETPAGLGRIIRDDGKVIAIVEEKDASEEQKAIQEINSGIMVVPAKRLNDWLSKVGNENQQGEYYLTDVIAMAAANECTVNATVITDSFEVQGVNDKTQLALLERHYQMNKADELLKAGVSLRDPARLDVRGELNAGSDVEIDVNVIFEGNVTLGDGVKIAPNVVIKNSSIGAGTSILAGSNIDGAEIKNNASVGPYARVRPGTVLNDEVKIGNFVETKNAVLGKGSKASHLAYIGDATLGENVNVGAGTIVCNYDGVNKHQTTIGNNVFIGSNSVLVAPVELADNAFIAAGSAINSDVPSDHLAVGRGKQRNIPGWKRPSKSEL